MKSTTTFDALSMKSVFAILIIALLTACGNRTKKIVCNNDPSTVTATNIDKEDEDLMMQDINESSPKNSRVIAKVVAIQNSSPEDIQMNSFCEAHPCMAKIEFMAMTHHGANFHRQYNEGDTIEARFVFTLDATDDIFPELNQPLPGLTKGDFFEAELFESDIGEFSIQIYDKK